MNILKKIFLAAISLLMIVLVVSGFSCSSPKNKNTITISGAFALYPMAVKWAEEYQKIYPGIRINLSAGGAGKGMTDVLSKMVDLGMVSRDISKEELKKGAWPVGVVEDAVVATMNTENPLIGKIQTRGINLEEFTDIFINEKIIDWGYFTVPPTKVKMVVYTRSDACGAAEVWAKYLGKKQENLKGIGVFGDPGIADAIKREPHGIGYSNINYVYDNQTKKPHKGMAVIPIDINNNGQIDPEENFYENINNLTEAIKKGKYPSPPARMLFFVASGKPENPEVLKFLKWILTDGQKFVNESGYVELSKEQTDFELKKLN